MIIWDHVWSSMIIWDHLWSWRSWRLTLTNSENWFFEKRGKTTWWISRFTQMNLFIFHWHVRVTITFTSVEIGGTTEVQISHVSSLSWSLVVYTMEIYQVIFCTLHSKESSCSLPTSKQEIGYIRWKFNSSAFFPKFPWLYCYMTILPHLCFLGMVEPVRAVAFQVAHLENLSWHCISRCSSRKHVVDVHDIQGWIGFTWLHHSITC